MPILKVKVVIERTRSGKDGWGWNDEVVGQVYEYETGKPIGDFQSFEFKAKIGGGAVGVSGPLPHLTNMHGEILYYDRTDSGITKTQYVEVTELSIVTKDK